MRPIGTIVELIPEFTLPYALPGQPVMNVTVTAMKVTDYYVCDGCDQIVAEETTYVEIELELAPRLPMHPTMQVEPATMPRLQRPAFALPAMPQFALAD